MHIAIDLLERPQPPYFYYEVDTLLRQLRVPPGEMGAVYLALLNAATVSPLPEPFTGLTGTEMAIIILQSTHCWSLDSTDNSSDDYKKAILWLECVGNLENVAEF